MREPEIHSGIIDCLPQRHPLANTDVYCLRCKRMLHANNNENLCLWIEVGLGAFCAPCFGIISDSMADMELGLPDDPKEREEQDDFIKSKVEGFAN